MTETDRQTDKTTRWAMTVYEDQWPLLEKMPEIIAEWGWQDEKCPDTGRLHRQGYFRTFRQVRFKQAREALPGVHIEPARDWNKLLNYCRKKESQVGGQVHQVNANTPMTMADTLIALAKYHWNEETLRIRFREGIQADKNYNRDTMYSQEYWACVNRFLEESNKDNAIGLFTNNQMILAWRRTRRHWIARYMNTLPAEPDSDSDAENIE